MGLFDMVAVSMRCPCCGHAIKYFQSKDGPCTLSLIDYNMVNNFYHLCASCGAWIELNYKGNKELQDFNCHIRVDKSYRKKNKIKSGKINPFQYNLQAWSEKDIQYYKKRMMRLKRILPKPKIKYMESIVYYV